MFDQHFGQTLLVQPSVTFTEIEHVLRDLGWTREDGQHNESSLIKGEPEVATWTRHGAKPFVIYTYNPVVSMRVLDVATLPPVMRAQIADKLKLIDDKKIAQLFKSEEIKERLLALWAAQETERIDLMPQVAALKNVLFPTLGFPTSPISMFLQEIKSIKN